MRINPYIPPFLIKTGNNKNKNDLESDNLAINESQQNELKCSRKNQKMSHVTNQVT